MIEKTCFHNLFRNTGATALVYLSTHVVFMVSKRIYSISVACASCTFPLKA